MNREIKFRSWSGEKFYYWGFINSVFVSPIYKDDAIIKEVQQFTGLKDKNDKEIYEGDIVKDIYFPFGAREDSEYSKIGIIVIEDLVRLGIKWEINECKYFNLPEDLKDNKFYQPHRTNWEHPTDKNWLQDFDNLYRMELIGNIYENLELLSMGSNR